MCTYTHIYTYIYEWLTNVYTHTYTCIHMFKAHSHGHYNRDRGQLQWFTWRRCFSKKSKGRFNLGPPSESFLVSWKSTWIRVHTTHVLIIVYNPFSFYLAHSNPIDPGWNKKKWACMMERIYVWQHIHMHTCVSVDVCAYTCVHLYTCTHTSMHCEICVYIYTI